MQRVGVGRRHVAVGVERQHGGRQELADEVEVVRGERPHVGQVEGLEQHLVEAAAVHASPITGGTASSSACGAVAVGRVVPERDARRLRRPTARARSTRRRAARPAGGREPARSAPTSTSDAAPSTYAGAGRAVPRRAGMVRRLRQPERAVGSRRGPRPRAGRCPGACSGSRTRSRRISQVSATSGSSPASAGSSRDATRSSASGGDEARQRHEAWSEQRPQAALDGGELVVVASGRDRASSSRRACSAARARSAAARSDASSVVAGTAASPTPNPHAAATAAWTGYRSRRRPVRRLERRDRRPRELPGPRRPVGELTDVDAGLAGRRGAAGASSRRAGGRAATSAASDRPSSSRSSTSRSGRSDGPARPGRGSPGRLWRRARRPRTRRRRRCARGRWPSGRGRRAGRCAAVASPSIDGEPCARSPGRGSRPARRRAPARRRPTASWPDRPSRRSVRRRRASTTPTRWVTVMPVRGVRTRSRSGGGASPRSMSPRRVDRGREVAADHVVDLLGLQQVRGGVDGDPEPAQHARGLAPQRRVLTCRRRDGRRRGPRCRPTACAARARRAGAARDRQRLLPGQGRHLAGVVDRCVEAALVQVALDEVAEDGAEAAAGPHPVEDALGQPHPLGRERDRERVVVVAAVGEVGVAQQGGDLGLVDRRGVQETRIVGRATQRSRLAVDSSASAPAASTGSGARSSTQPYPPTSTPVGRSARAARRVGGWPARWPTRPPGGTAASSVPATCGPSSSALASARCSTAARKASMSAAAGSPTDASLARTVTSPIGRSRCRRPSERRVAEPEQLGVAFRGHRGVGDQSGRGGGVLAQPALADQRGQHATPVVRRAPSATASTSVASKSRRVVA